MLCMIAHRSCHTRDVNEKHTKKVSGVTDELVGVVLHVDLSAETHGATFAWIR